MTGDAADGRGRTAAATADAAADATNEVLRRVVHAAGALFPALYLAELVTWSELQVLYVGGVVLAVVLEFLRLVVGVDWWVFSELTREYEQSNPAAYSLYTVSSATVVVAFEPELAVPAVLMLALADPVSGALATGERRRVKRLHVLAVTFGICTLIATSFVPLVPALLGALTATVADGVKVVVGGYVLDDDLTIPLGVASAMFLAQHLTL